MLLALLMGILALGNIYPGYEEYAEIRKGLYVWSHHTANRLNGVPSWIVLTQNNHGEMQRLVDFCKMQGVDKVLLFAGSVEWEYDDYYSRGVFPYHEDLLFNVRFLQTQGLDVDLMVYLNDEPNNLTAYERMEEVAQIVKKLNKEGTNIGSLHIDQEPSKQNQYKKLLEMLSLSRQQCPIGVSLKPQWVRERLTDITAFFTIDDVRHLPEFKDFQPTKETTFSDLVLMVAPNSTMMAYSNEPDTILSLGRQALDSASRVGLTRLDIAMETGFVNNLPEEETTHYWIQANKPLWFKRFRCLGGKLERYAQELGLKTKMIVHDYAQYHTTLYCQSPALEKMAIEVPYLSCEGDPDTLISRIACNRKREVLDK
ncbi:hypothetical protein GMRT_13341 [Giardia muris]|uniref:Uncharacterized protein n=1 Tax=Giardia muris TaxID=5742 RepID=A0A4Z1SKW5_GIAMU|nr:hypothetical protein GMRT_13341 [Giardia muris]|eukprot:TNJ26306.1 hypothetical protein GMRT_13341 [Giardia muris]